MIGHPREALLFFGAVFAASWACWWTASALGELGDPHVTALYGLGALAPGIVAILLVWMRSSPAERAEFRARLLEPARVGWRNAAVIVAIPAAATGLAAGVELARGAGVGGPGPFVVPAVVAFALAAAAVEEPGWRGYALPRLAPPLGLVGASLVLGVVWAAWHIPLYFIEGSFQHDNGFLSARFWLYSLALLPESLLYTFFVVRTRWSVLGALLFHAATNATGELVDLEFAGIVVRACVVAALAGAAGWWLWRRARPAAAE